MSESRCRRVQTINLADTVLTLSENLSFWCKLRRVRSIPANVDVLCISARVALEPSSTVTLPTRAKAMSSTYRGKFIQGRPHRPFPVLLRPADEAEGAAILRELPDSSGVMLYGALRDVMLWLLAPQGERGSLFPEGSGRLRRENIERGEVEPDLLPFLLRVAAVTEAAETHSPAEVGALCAEIGAWAGANDLPYIELAFIQACAISRPDLPAHALRTARLARDLGQYVGAETWFRRTIKVARVQKDWSTYVDAFRGLGVFYLRTGNTPAARNAFDRTLSLAKRYRLRELVGAAHHDLFQVYADAGEIRTAYDHAIAAQNAYGTLDDYLARLAADVGQFWILLGRPNRAVPIFERLVTRAPTIDLAALWTANLVRASALSGMNDLYEFARKSTLNVVDALKKPLRLAECFVIVALADVAMEEWERAGVTAGKALVTAERIGSAEVQIKAEEILQAVACRRTVVPAEPTETPGLARIGDNLADQLREALAS
jgi:tetratricopeptide (TPR) repeat protein